jgi:CRP-like cAMP-binding protein
VALFGDCSEEELALVGSMLARVDVVPGTILIHQGGADRRFFVITEGYASVSRSGTDLGTVGPGSFVGEMALLNDRPRSAAVTAITPMTVWAIDPDPFHRLLDQVPSVAEKVRRVGLERAAFHDGDRQRLDAARPLEPDERRVDRQSSYDRLGSGTALAGVEPGHVAPEPVGGRDDGPEEGDR